MKRTILTLLSILLICSACMNNPIEKPVIDPASDDDIDLHTGTVAYNPNPRYSREELDGLVLGHNQFALALYKLLANNDKNLVFGHHHPKFDFDEEVLPISVSLMLGMLMKLDFLKTEENN